MLRTRWLRHCLVASLLVLAACSGSTESDVEASGVQESDAGSETTAGDVQDSTEVSESSAASEIASPLPTGTFATIDGGEIELTSLEGEDVVLWFWAPW